MPVLVCQESSKCFVYLYIGVNSSKKKKEKLYEMAESLSVDGLDGPGLSLTGKVVKYVEWWPKYWSDPGPLATAVPTGQGWCF